MTRTQSAVVCAFTILVAAACGWGFDRSTGESTIAFNLDNAAVTADARVVPEGMLAISVSADNTGSTTWRVDEVTLVLENEPTFGGGSLALAAETKRNRTGTFTGTLTAPAQIGVYELSFRAQHLGAPFGPAIVHRVEVTCSDGLFCNGMERWVDRACQAGPNPCDDLADCTTDTCDEATGRCGHELGADCATCDAPNCTPNCHGAVCGDDGCGGSCGACAGGETCVGGACLVVTQPGICSNPFPLLAPGEPLLGAHVITGDTTTGIDETVPSCNATSPAPEVVYVFTVTEPTGVDARSSGYDTVLHIRRASCTDPHATVACSDDASPPGNFGSRVAVLLQPDTYYMIVDGFDASSFGPFTLSANFVAGCVPACDGKFCGDDGCGGSCGACAAGEECSASATCVPSPCAPVCNGRQCGPDACGGTCGTCDSDQLCVIETGACRSFASCDHDRPVCQTACSRNEFCGSDCECHRLRDAQPDLVINETRLLNEVIFDEVTFGELSCAIVEECVGGPGTRQLMRFSTEAINQGQATLLVPPPEERPDLFEYSPCHGHYHFSGFAEYALLDPAGNVVLTGRKQAYCMEDTIQAIEGPNVSCEKQYDCANQGIQAGWSDLYGNALDCQWLDITGIPPGGYLLRVSVNPNRSFEEVSFDNNTSIVPVIIP